MSASVSASWRAATPVARGETRSRARLGLFDAPRAARRSRRSAALASSAAPSASASGGDVSVSRDESDRLSLDNIRASLIRQEDSIIFGLIERAQYKRNDAVYEAGAVDVPCYHPDGKRASMLEFMLRESEQLGGKIRRYTSPDEHAFYPESLPMLVIGSMEYPCPLHPAAEAININDRIMRMYVEKVLPALCEAGDDNNSAALAWRTSRTCRPSPSASTTANSSPRASSRRGRRNSPN